jgi:hypothetical protein
MSTLKVDTIESKTLNGDITVSSLLSGSGASLTNLPAGNLTGTVADARISTLTASKLTGALPAISGASLTNLPSTAGLTLIDGGATGGGSTVDFTSGIGNTYDKYIFYISNARANSNSTNLCMQVSTDGGSSWKTGGTDYEYASHGYDSGGTNRTKTSTGDSKIFLSDLAKMGTSEGMYSGFIGINEADHSGKWTHFEWVLRYGHQTSGDICIASGTGAYRATATVNAIRFLWSAGSFSDGNIRLYGIKDS